jgi:hypothetical protein
VICLDPMRNLLPVFVVIDKTNEVSENDRNK